MCTQLWPIYFQIVCDFFYTLAQGIPSHSFDFNIFPIPAVMKSSVAFRWKRDAEWHFWAFWCWINKVFWHGDIAEVDFDGTIMVSWGYTVWNLVVEELLRFPVVVWELGPSRSVLQNPNVSFSISSSCWDQTTHFQSLVLWENDVGRMSWVQNAIGKGSQNCVVLVGIVAVVACLECIGYSCKRQTLVVCAASAVCARVERVSSCGYAYHRCSIIFAKEIAQAAGLRYNLSSLFGIRGGMCRWLTASVSVWLESSCSFECEVVLLLKKCYVRLCDLKVLWLMCHGGFGMVRTKVSWRNQIFAVYREVRSCPGQPSLLYFCSSAVHLRKDADSLRRSTTSSRWTAPYLRKGGAEVPRGKRFKHCSVSNPRKDADKLPPSTISNRCSVPNRRKDRYRLSRAWDPIVKPSFSNKAGDRLPWPRNNIRVVPRGQEWKHISRSAIPNHGSGFIFVMESNIKPWNRSINAVPQALHGSFFGSLRP